MIKKNLTLISGPILALLMMLFLDLSPEHPEITRMAAIVVWMAIWWLTEAVSLPVTALIPVVLYPLLGIMSAQEVAPNYFNSILFLFMGGFIIAIAMERWELHRRIALSIINIVGSGRKQLLLGFMLATAFLSMWISNTATAMMMVPIALAIVTKLEEHSEQELASQDNQNSKVIQRYSIGLFLAIAYSANIGGFATLIGTPPNLAFMGIFQEQFPNAPEISFTQWLSFALPIAITLLAFVWAYLSFLFVRCTQNKEANQIAETSQRFFKKQYQELGSMSTEEKVVASIFALTAVLWVTRSSFFGLSGWGEWLPQANDSTVAITMAMLLFVIPSKNAPSQRILHWDDLKQFPWGILILFGGGFALADGFGDSGLSQWIGQQLMVLGDFPPIALIITSCTGMTFLTEFTSNTPSTQMFLPILASISVSNGIHPLLLMVPTTIAASCAFMLPVATPPNVIIFGTHRVPIVEMAQTGLVINFVAIIVITLFTILLGEPIFGITWDSMPDWAK